MGPSFSSRLFAFFNFLSFLTFCFHALRTSFDSIFSYLLHHTPSVHHSFLFRQMPRLLFYEHWVQYERSLANSSNLVTFLLLRPSEWATVVLGAWGVNRYHVKQFHRNSFFQWMEWVSAEFIGSRIVYQPLERHLFHM